MEVVTKKYGPVRFPEEILIPGGHSFYEEDDEERVTFFYAGLLSLMRHQEREAIDYMMTWEDTLQGHDFWRQACRENYTWPQFMKTEAYALLKGAEERMYHVEVWSPERVKELL